MVFWDWKYSVFNCRDWIVNLILLIYMVFLFWNVYEFILCVFVFIYFILVSEYFSILFNNYYYVLYVN